MLLALFFVALMANAATAEQFTIAYSISNSVDQNSATVFVGDTLTWNNVDNVPHTVTNDEGEFMDPFLPPHQSFSHTFNTPGVFKYDCDFHTFMIGLITVSSAVPPTVIPSGMIALIDGSLGNCPSGSTILPLQNSCMCPSGEQYNATINQCISVPPFDPCNPNPCNPMAVCTVAPHMNHDCKCATGYTGIGDNIGPFVDTCAPTCVCPTGSLCFGQILNLAAAQSQFANFPVIINTVGSDNYICSIPPPICNSASIVAVSGCVTCPHGSVANKTTNICVCSGGLQYNAQTNTCDKPTGSVVVVEWCLNCDAYVTVNVGDTVVWVNTDHSEAHTVTDFALPHLLDSVEYLPGQVYSYTFTQAGVFPYFCYIHPWMVGAITVNPRPMTDISVTLYSRHGSYPSTKIYASFTGNTGSKVVLLNERLPNGYSTFTFHNVNIGTLSQVVLNTNSNHKTEIVNFSVSQGSNAPVTGAGGILIRGSPLIYNV